ncbi:MAG: inositol monophosphatase family protein [Gemmatimonadales bacterium]
MSTIMEAAAEIAQIAAANAMSYYGKPLDAEFKQDGSPVTAADRTSERLARDWIEQRFPGDGILGEEYGVLRPDARRRWIIDPIDGTKAFVRGIPFWGSMIAVVEGEDVLAGAVSFPVLGETLVAAPGEGCWWNDSRCSVSRVHDLSSATVLTTDAAFKGESTKARGWAVLASIAAVSRTWGDCVGYLLVATGRAEVMADPVVSPWDVVAVMPAIVEAGGVFTDWNGEASAFRGSAIATNAALADESRRTLLGVGQANSV